MNGRLKVACAAGAAMALGLWSQSALAAIPVYQDVGQINPTTYTFTAAKTGDIVAYFAGSTASYDETLTMLVNGVNTGIVGLDDHSSHVGESLNLGYVKAGSTLTFEINVLTTGQHWFSDPTLNSDGENRVFSTSYLGDDDGIPEGTYVGFEDWSDWNYHDETFVFTDVTTVATTPGQPPVVTSPPGVTPGPQGTSTPPLDGPDTPPLGPTPPGPTQPGPTLPLIAAPEPSAWAMMLLGVGALGASLRRRGALVRASA